MEIKRLEIIVLSLLLAFTASAQYKFSGIIVDSKGAPIFAATIKAIDISDVGTISQVDGKFELTVPLGKHQFSISKSNIIFYLNLTLNLYLIDIKLIISIDFFIWMHNN